MTRARLPKSVDLSTHPTRTAFLDAYLLALIAAGENRSMIQPKDHALRWFFAVIDKPPHEITHADFEKFMSKAAGMGARSPRLTSLRFALELAFDQMCGHPIVEPPKRQSPVPVHGTARQLPREKLIERLAVELGLTPRDVERVRWENIDFDGQMIVLPSRKGSGRRRVALTRRANDLLMASKPGGEAQGSFVFARAPAS